MRKDFKKYRVLIILLVIFILVYGIVTYYNNHKSIYIDNTKDLVYTYYEDKDYEKEVPKLNVKNISNEINNQIEEFVVDYINKETNKIYYKYQVNGNILSVIVIIEDYSIEGSANYSFLSYVIDLKKLKVLDNNDILELFNRREDKIINNLNDQFKVYYQDEIDNKIIDNISYEQFLNIHEITNFKDEIHYYIEDGKLYIYLDYIEWASEETLDYFLEVGYIFLVD